MGQPDESLPVESPNVLLEIDKKQYNILDMLDILDSPRTSTSFHLKKSVAQAFRAYARRHPSFTVADCLETALMEYMDNNPLEEVTFTFEIVEATKDAVLNSKIKEKIFIDQILRILKTIDRFKEQKSERYLGWIPELQEVLLKAVKLKNPSDEMIALLERAETYL